MSVNLANNIFQKTAPYIVPFVAPGLVLGAWANNTVTQAKCRDYAGSGARNPGTEMLHEKKDIPRFSFNTPEGCNRPMPLTKAFYTGAGFVGGGLGGLFVPNLFKAKKIIDEEREDKAISSELNPRMQEVAQRERLEELEEIKGRLEEAGYSEQEIYFAITIQNYIDQVSSPGTFLGQGGLDQFKQLINHYTELIKSIKDYPKEAQNIVSAMRDVDSLMKNQKENIEISNSDLVRMQSEIIALMQPIQKIIDSAEK
ncbi:MAG: hypothetical protein MK033_01710 [Candidatus Caenarcaniphilales bacterium]|nr:hypothetical protein [Candidatus Caenarcaniphilales bacterium]